MTCREKLKQEHPEHINPQSLGGCDYCPDTYKYLDKPEWCDGPVDDKNERCTKCWDREIPGTDEDIQKFANTYGISYGEAEKIINRHSCYTDGTEKIVDGGSKPISVSMIKPTVQIGAFEIKSDDKGCVITPLPYKPGDIAYGRVAPDEPSIKDSGNRREFETGAVRDIQEGKGRCDLLPLDVVLSYCTQMAPNTKFEFQHVMFLHIHNFVDTGNHEYLYRALANAAHMFKDDHYTMLLEVSKHFEEGAKKYGEYNWQKGIPTHCYIDSAVRHYLKYLRGDKDEPHDRAFVWNILCCIWTCVHKPELNDYRPAVEKKKRSKREILERNARINEERKKRLGTKG